MDVVKKREEHKSGTRCNLKAIAKWCQGRMKLDSVEWECVQDHFGNQEEDESNYRIKLLVKRCTEFGEEYKQALSGMEVLPARARAGADEREQET